MYLYSTLKEAVKYSLQGNVSSILPVQEKYTDTNIDLTAGSGSRVCSLTEKTR